MFLNKLAKSSLQFRSSRDWKVSFIQVNNCLKIHLRAHLLCKKHLLWKNTSTQNSRKDLSRKNKNNPSSKETLHLPLIKKKCQLYCKVSKRKKTNLRERRKMSVQRQVGIGQGGGQKGNWNVQLLSNPSSLKRSYLTEAVCSLLCFLPSHLGQSLWLWRLFQGFEEPTGYPQSPPKSVQNNFARIRTQRNDHN